MKFLPFVLKHLLRNWVRTGSTVVAMALCVLLFCTLQSALGRLDRIVETRSPKRLVTRNGVNPFVVIPVAYAEQIKRVPGVKRVSVLSMFGGLLPAMKEGKADEAGSLDWSNAFGNVAVDAEPYFAMNPELRVPPHEFRDFMADLRGCVIGRELAKRFGWKIGDHFHLTSFGPLYKKRPIEFIVRGFIDADPERPDTETNVMLFHFRYLYETFEGKIGTSGYLIEIDDPRRAGELAGAIDALFENASHPTVTESEKAATAEIMSMFGDLGVLVKGIGLSVCFTILLVTANTMSMAVRERRTEIAVLKTLGFKSGQVMGLIVAEALVLGALGGTLGIFGTQALLWMLDHASNRTWIGLSGIELKPLVALFGLGVAVVLGFAAGLMPAWGAYRAKVTEMLRTI